MANLKFCAAVMLGLGVAAVGAAPARASDAAAVTWGVGAKPDQDGKFEKCLANGAAEDGRTLAFVIARDGRFVGLAVNPKWKLVPKSSHKVSFEIDGKSGGHLDAAVVAENALVYPLANSRSLIEALSDGAQFVLRIDGKATAFSLKGAGDALKGLHECWAEGVKTLKK